MYCNQNQRKRGSDFKATPALCADAVPQVPGEREFVLSGKKDLECLKYTIVPKKSDEDESDEDNYEIHGASCDCKNCKDIVIQKIYGEIDKYNLYYMVDKPPPKAIVGTSEQSC